MKKHFDSIMHRIVHSKKLNKIKDWFMNHMDGDKFIFFKKKFK